MKKKVLAATLLAAGAVIGHLHASLQSYHPVIKVAAPGEVTFTVALDPKPSRPACSSAARAFLEPVRAQCPDCEVLWARCERELQDLALALESEQPLPLYVVATANARVAIAADEARARDACQLIAGDALRRGVSRASCILPATVRKTDTKLAEPEGIAQNRTTP